MIEFDAEVDFRTSTIQVQDLPVVRERVAKANRRLAKAGIVERFELAVSDKRLVEHRDPVTNLVIDRYYEVDVRLVVPSIGYNGWRFAATLSFEQAGTVVRTVPGEVCDYRPTSQVCDQCGTVRERNETFVVRNDETGEYKQLGRNCLELFLGVKPSLWIYDVRVGTYESEGGFGGGVQVESVRSIVAAALAVSDAGRAYRSKAAAEYSGAATSEETRACLYERVTGSRPADQERKQELQAWRVQAAEYLREGTLIDAVIEAAKAIEGDSEYAGNIRVLAACEHVDVANIGFVASFVAVYNRAIKRQAERVARTARAAASSWIGNEGDKKVATVGTVTGLRKIEGAYGTTLLVEWTTAEGDVCKWFASNWYGWTEDGKTGVGISNKAANTPIDLGTQIAVVGTIKKHDEFKGLKATVFTRCTVEAVQSPFESSEAA